MEQLFLILLTILLLATLTAIFFLYKKLQESQKPKEGDQNLFMMLQQQIQELNKTVDAKMSETHNLLDNKLTDTNKSLSDHMSKTFATSTKINETANQRIEDITKKLTELGETNKQIQDIGNQLRGLENVLKNPKQRGNLGEYFLKELLENVFNPEQYKLQYTLTDIGIVDAALFIGEKIIPIDSKFPHDNYERLINSEDEYSIKKYSTDLKRDIKTRIDETSKYISPESETTDFAFMLIPAEGMYYDLFINRLGDIEPKKLIEYAFSKKVIICSPSSFYAYLQTVLQGMKALQIEEQAKEIQKNVIKLQKDLAKYDETFKKVGNSLGTTVGHYNDASKRLAIIDTDIIKITDTEKIIEPIRLDRPRIEE